MNIGILQAGQVPLTLKKTYGNYNQMFEKLLAGNEFSFTTFLVSHNVFPESPTTRDAWLITGSKHGAYERLDWIIALENFIRQVYKQQVPIVGVCFGHQILAKALGGKVEKFSGGWKVGFENLRIQEKKKQVSVLSFYQDQVVEIPNEAKVIGVTDFCKYAMLKYKDAALSIQQHPEFTPEFVRELIDEKQDIVPYIVRQQAKQTLHQKVDNDALEIIIKFLKKHKK